MKPRYVLTVAGPMRKGSTPDLMLSVVPKRRPKMNECDYAIRFLSGPIRESAIALKVELIKARAAKA